MPDHQRGIYNNSNNKQLGNHRVSSSSFLIRLSSHKRFSYPFAGYIMRPYNPALSLSPYGGRHYNIAAHTGQQQHREGRNIDRELVGEQHSGRSYRGETEGQV